MKCNTNLQTPRRIDNKHNDIILYTAHTRCTIIPNTTTTVVCPSVMFHGQRTHNLHVST